MNALLARPWARHTLQLLVLLAILAVVWLERELAGPGTSVFAAIVSLGLLFMAGSLVSELVEPFGLPHLTGYLLAGMLVGPHLLGLIDTHTVEQLGVLNQLALALIALAGGAELRIASVRRALRSLAWAHLLQTVATVALVGLAFFALSGYMPFLHGVALPAVAMIAVLWGILAATRSPSATLALMAQYRPRGPLTDMTVAFVMSSDIVIVVVLAVALSAASAVIDPAAAFGMATFLAAGGKLLGSALLGTALGLALIAYLRWGGRNLLFALLLIGFPVSQLLKHLALDSLLSFLVAGFVVQNFSRHGDKLLHAIEGTAEVVFVVFFATAGAHLDLPGFASVWPVAVALAGLRIAVTWGAARASSRLADDPPVIRRWGWSGLVSQAGLALGVAIVITHEFPQFGAGFATLAVGVVGINEVVGPILFKIALKRAGEVGPAARHGG